MSLTIERVGLAVGSHPKQEADGNPRIPGSIKKIGERKIRAEIPSWMLMLDFGYRTTATFFIFRVASLVDTFLADIFL